jgi:hypothetical protein
MRIVLYILLFITPIYWSVGQVALFHEDFENPSGADSVIAFTTGVQNWTINTQYYASGTQSFNKVVSIGDSSTLTTLSFSTVGHSYVGLSFKHICKIHFLDMAEVYVSNNNGTSWNKLTGPQYLGNGNFSSFNSAFNSIGYADWQPGNDTATPQQSWWKEEYFDITSFVLQSTHVKIMFVLRDGDNLGSNGNYGWLIDDIKITGGPSEMFPPSIALSSPIQPDTSYSTGPFILNAMIDDLSGIDTAFVVYTVNGGIPDTAGMDHVSGNLYSVVLPSYTYNTSICYSIVAVDGSFLQNTATFPASGCRSMLILQGLGVVTIGNGTLSNTTTTYPAPYGNRFRGAKHRFLIPGEELNAAGLSPGHIVSLGFDVITAQGTPLQGFTIKMGHTTLHTLTNTFSGSLQTVYSTGSYTETAGWNTHVFQTPFYWNGVDNLIIETCFNNTSSTNNAIVRQSSTSYASSLYFRDNTSVVCSQIAGTLAYQRPNIRLNTAPSNFPYDAGISQILTSPVSGTSTHNLQVRVKNYGTDTIVKAQLFYSINNGPAQGPVSWTGSLAPGVSSALVSLGSFSFSYGNINLSSWTTLPNDSTDQNAVNDGITISYFNCPDPFAGDFTIGGANSDFMSVNDAIEAMLTCGIDGHVVFRLAPGTYTGQFVIPQIPTASDTSTITFRSATVNPNDVVFLRPTTAGSGNYTINFNTARYVSLKQVTVRSTTTTYGKVIVFDGHCRNITIDSCLIDAPVGTSNSTVPVSASTSSLDRDIVISNCTIKGGLHGIVFAGSITTRKSRLSILNNVIEDFYSRGITIDYSDTVSIHSNLVKNRTVSDWSAIGISVENTNGFGEVASNKVHMQSSTIQTGIYIAFKQANMSEYLTLANNFVTQGGTGGLSGIFVTMSNYVNIFFNSVNIVAGSSDALFHSSGSNININNNIFSNMSSGSGYAYRSNTPSAITSSDYNNLYRTGPNMAFWSGTAYSDLMSLQAVSMMDIHSQSIQPPFSSPVDLYLSSPVLSKLGTYLTLVPFDIDGNIRGNPPTIGAHEVPYIPFDAGVSLIAYPNSSSVISQNDLVTPLVVVTNYGSDSIMSMTIAYTINYGMPDTTSYTGPLPPNGIDTVTLTPFVSPAGNTVMTAYTILQGDSNTFNDTSYFVYSGIFSIDGSLKRFHPILSSCGMGTDTLKIVVANMSVKDTINIFTASYQVSGSPIIFTDTVIATILPLDSVVHHFSTSIDFSVSNADSIFIINSWVNIPGDNFNNNDSLTLKVRSRHIPNPPIVSNVTIPYGTSVNLSAQSTNTVYWFDSDTANVELFKGSQYSTPNLFDTTTYWVEASTTVGNSGLFSIGSSSTSNASSGPILVNDVSSSYVYSNHISIIEPGSFSGLNGYITSLSWYKANTGAYNLPDGELRIYLKHTSVSSISSSAGTFASQLTGATLMYESTTQTIPLTFGWKEFTFNTQNEFLYNGISNLMILVEWYRPGNITSSITWSYSQAVGKAQSWAGATNPPAVPYGAGERPNIRINMSPLPGCISSRVPVTVNVSTPPPVDAGVVNIINPGSYVLSGNTINIDVQFKNYGLNNLTSVLINHSINGVVMAPYLLTGINLPKDSISDTIFLSTNILQSGYHTLKVWTSQPNGANDTVNTNDTLLHTFPVCMGGVYTLGSVTSDFPTFASAINALNSSPVCTHVVFNVEPGVYNMQLTIPQIPNLGPDATLTFQSATGDSTDVVIQFATTSANNRVVMLNGARYITFNKMTFQATGIDQGRVIEFLNGAGDITISNCVIKTSNTSNGTAFAGIFCDFQSISNDVVIANNLFIGGYYGISWTGNTGYIKRNIRIENNIIEDFYAAAIFNRYTDSIYVLSNTFSNRLGGGLVYGIYSQYLQGYGRIMKNRINIQSSNVQYAIHITDKTIGSLSELTIANNFISMTGSTTTSYGVHIAHSPYINLYYNSVSMNGGDVNNGRAFNIVGNTNNIRIKNNILSNFWGGYTLFLDANTVIQSVECNHNNYYSTGQYLAYWGSAVTSLAALKVQNGMDSNSISVDPLYTSLINLSPAASSLYQAGVTIVDINDDIFNNPRPLLNPCIGAVEFVSAINDAAIVAIPSPGSVVTGTDSVIITLKNAGSNSLTSVTIHWQVNGQAQPSFNWVGNMAPNSSVSNIFLGNYPFVFGSYMVQVWVSQPNGMPDGYTGNDTMIKNVVACSGYLRGTYSLGGTKADFHSFQDAVNALINCGIDSTTVFLVNTGFYFEHIEIPFIQGTSALNSITFCSATSDSNAVQLLHTPLNSQDAWVVYLNGAKHVHFRQISLKSSGTVGSRTVLLRNGADHNRFEGCVIEAPVTNQSVFSCIYTDNGSADHYNVFKGNRILNGYHGIHIVGSAGNRKRGYVIEDNLISGFHYYGIYALYADSILILNNRLLNTTLPSNTTGYHIQVYYNDGYAKISKNRVHSTNPHTSAGIAYGYATSVPSNYTEISNNFISQSGASTAFRGIAVYGSNSRVNILNNSISVQSHSANGTCLFIGGGQCKLLCNNLANFGVQGYAFYVDSLQFITRSDYNNLYTTGINFAHAGSGFTNLSLFQASTTLDSNSVSTDPLFIGISDLHSGSPILDGSGIPLTGIIDDIDGDLRNPISPDIGADEYSFHSIDIGPWAIISPTVLSSHIGANMDVEIRVRNHGTDTVNSFSLTYIYAGLPAVNTIITGQLLPGKTVDYSFSVPLTLVPGTQELKIFTTLPGDSNSSNDSVKLFLTGRPIFALPWSDNFDTLPDFWVKEGMLWQRGQPAGAVINSPNSYLNVWATNLVGNYTNNANEWLYSPYFNFSYANGSELSFYQSRNITDHNDGGNIQVSLNGGATWLSLGYFGDTLGTNWYNHVAGGQSYFTGSTNGWVKTTYDLRILNYTQTPVQFRFRFFSNISGTGEGWAIDNFSISLPVYPLDAAVQSVDQPSGSTLNGSLVTVQTTIRNHGSTTITTLPLGYRVNNQPVVNETWSGTLLPDSSATFTFATPYTSPNNPYNLCVFTKLPGDQNPLNDTVCVTLNTTLIPLDAGIEAIIEPSTTSIAQTQITVKARIKNFGSQTLTTIPLEYSTGLIINSESWSGVLLPGSSVDYSFTNTLLGPVGPYTICVRTNLVNDGDTANDHLCINVLGVTGIDESAGKGFSVMQNRPNPFNGITDIELFLPEPGEVIFTITDMVGNTIRRDLLWKNYGAHIIHIDLEGIPSGIYFYTVEFRGERIVKKMVVL